MAPDDAPQTPRRRGRPPGSKNRTTTPRRKRAASGDLVTQLNSMVAELISKNRQLQRQVEKLTQRVGASSATKGVERSLRTISRRVQKALGGAPKRRGRKPAAAANGRRRKTSTRRRKAS